MGKEDLFVAFPAFHLHFRTHRAAAVFDRVQRVELPCRKRAAVLPQEPGFESLDDAGEPDHLMFPQPIEIRSIRALMRSRALPWVHSVRWV